MPPKSLISKKTLQNTDSSIPIKSPPPAAVEVEEVEDAPTDVENVETDDSIEMTPGTYNYDQLDQIRLESEAVETRKMAAKDGEAADSTVSTFNVIKLTPCDRTTGAKYTFKDGRVNTTILFPEMHFPNGVMAPKQKKSYESYSVRAVFSRSNEAHMKMKEDWQNYIDAAVCKLIAKNRVALGTNFLRFDAKTPVQYKSPLFVHFDPETNAEIPDKDCSMFLKLFSYPAKENQRASATEFITVTGLPCTKESLMNMSFSGFPVVKISELRTSANTIFLGATLVSLVLTTVPKPAEPTESRGSKFARMIRGRNPGFAQNFVDFKCPVPGAITNGEEGAEEEAPNRLGGFGGTSDEAEDSFDAA